MTAEIGQIWRSPTGARRSWRIIEINGDRARIECLQTGAQDTALLSLISEANGWTQEKAPLMYVHEPIEPEDRDPDNVIFRAGFLRGMAMRALDPGDQEALRRASRSLRAYAGMLRELLDGAASNAQAPKR
jgi:hypothetical protein